MSTDVSELISALSAPDPAERSGAAEQLAQLGPDARSAAVPLVRACADESEEVRQWATAALEELGQPAASEVDALAPLLGHSSPEVGYWAATLLGRLEAAAAAAVPALAAAVSGQAENQGVNSVRERSAWALGRIGPPASEAIDALRKAAAEEDPRLARLARRAMDQIGGR